MNNKNSLGIISVGAEGGGVGWRRGAEFVCDSLGWVFIWKFRMYLYAPIAGCTESQRLTKYCLNRLRDTDDVCIMFCGVFTFVIVHSRIFLSLFTIFEARVTFFAPDDYRGSAARVYSDFCTIVDFMI